MEKLLTAHIGKKAGWDRIKRYHVISHDTEEEVEEETEPEEETEYLALASVPSNQPFPPSGGESFYRSFPIEVRGENVVFHTVFNRVFHNYNRTSTNFSTLRGGKPMSYCHTCPHCGAHLDPGEPCDCPDALIGAAMLLSEDAANRWGPKSQAIGNLDKKTAANSAKADSGEVEQTLTGPDSTSIIPKTEEEIK